MELSLDQVMVQAMPIIKTLLWVGGGLIFLLILAYYLFVIKRRRTWKVNIWERKANNRLYLVGKDVLIEKRFNAGKQTSYLLKRNKRETLPPPENCVDRLGRKEEANYLRILEDYIPMNREVSLPLDRKTFALKIKASVEQIKSLARQDIDERYVYAPMDRVLTGSLNFSPIDYDVNMMRINALDNREKIYQDAKDWMAKYGHLVAIGVIAALMIVVLYLSYDYSQNVINAAASNVGGALNAIADKLGVAKPIG